MATTAQYTAQPIIDIAQVTTADSSLTAPTNKVTVCSGPATAAANGVGKRILRVTVCATANTTATTLRFFLTKDNDSTRYLIVEKLIPAVTISAGSVAAYRTEVPELVGLILPGGTGGSTHSIIASYSASVTLNIIVESGTL